jgi:hypothetical protein
MGDTFGKFARVRSLHLDGTVMLDDGREMQLVASNSTGALGVIPKTVEEHIAALDQSPQAQPSAAFPPPMSSLKLDQAVVPVRPS